MYLRKSWYVAAWSKEVAERPLGRRLLGEPIVLFRTEAGEVVALADRCPHRHLPLSMGKVTGALIQCGYHGAAYDGTGKCARIPSQSLIPPRLRAKAYPCQERHGWIWVWMGDAKDADPTLIPDFHRLTDPRYASVGKANHVRAGYKLVTDNLMDLSHVGFVHTSTIGNPEFTEKGTMTVTKRHGRVKAVRNVPDVPPPPTYVKTGRLPAGKNIDRWQVIEFIAPCFVLIHVGGAEAGTGALEGRYDHGLNFWIHNAMTPESPTTTHYFWAAVRSHAIGVAAVDELVFAQVSEAFEEDRRILEAQQDVLQSHEDSWSNAFKADAASVEARRILDKMIADERTSA